MSKKSYGFKQYHSRQTQNRLKRILKQHLKNARNKPLAASVSIGSSSDQNPMVVNYRKSIVNNKPMFLGGRDNLLIIRYTNTFTLSESEYQKQIMIKQSKK